MINYKSINERITDRLDSWCWQTDRKISQQEVSEIWHDRHAGITDAELMLAVNKELKSSKLIGIEPRTDESQETLGFVNSVRVGVLVDGTKVIIRCHPKGIKNGYFYAESLAAKKALELGLPAFKTYAIHELHDENDFAFQVIEKIEGTALKKWLEKHPEDIQKLSYETGKMMAKFHHIEVDGFGSLDNEQAKEGKLIGLHKNLASFVRASLPKNLDSLVHYKTITKQQAEKINTLFAEDNPLLKCSSGVLIHNDFVDWNLLTDGKKITGILDFDECAAGDPTFDIASWSSMTPQYRLDSFLSGYFEGRQKPENFEDKLKLISFRWVISNMSLRNSRLEYMPGDAHLQQLVADGKTQMAFYMNHFGINKENAQNKC